LIPPELQRPTPGILLEKTGRNLASVIAGIREEDPQVIRRIRSFLANASTYTIAPG